MLSADDEPGAQVYVKDRIDYVKPLWETVKKYRLLTAQPSGTMEVSKEDR